VDGLPVWYLGSMRRPLHWPIAGTLLLAGAAGLEAQAPRYQPLHLDCARYQVHADAVIVTVAGGARSRETTGRQGIISVRGTRLEGDSLLRLEAWFDSLSLFREGDGERLEPDTDGLIGGRFRAQLTPGGGATSTDLPFFPDDVAQVTDLSTALTDLLPPLPPRSLAPGTGWKDAFGTVITRLGDMTLAGRRVERYRLSRRSSTPVRQLLPDSSTVTANRTESEDGTYYWSTELGVVRWERDLTDEMAVEKGDVVKQPFQTRIEQKVSLQRMGGSCS
jgi:hypothetical protein